jgi:hypothetical protein
MYVVSKFQGWELLPSSESISWLTLLRVSAVAIVVGLWVFIYSFRRTLRLLNDSIELDLKLMAYFERPLIRMVLIVTALACIGRIGDIIYVRASYLHSSEYLARQLMNSDDWLVTTSASKELIRRGPSAVAPIIGVIESVPEQDKKHSKWENYRSYPSLKALFNVLGEIKTEESRQELYKWVRRKDYSPTYRYMAVVQLARNYDTGWIPWAEDLFGAENEQKYLLTLVLPYADKQVLLDAMPYIRTVPEQKLIPENNTYDVSICVSSLARIDTDESRELLARIAQYSDSCKKEAAKAIGEDRLAEILTKYPKREPVIPGKR